MRGQSEVIDKLRELGYVTRDEAAKACGRVAGGSLHALLVGYGVRFVPIPMGGKTSYMYYLADLKKVPIRTTKPRTCKAAESTESVSEVPVATDDVSVMKRHILNLEDRIAILESRKVQKFLV